MDEDDDIELAVYLAAIEAVLAEIITPEYLEAKLAEIIGGNRGRTVNDYEPDHIDRVDCLRCAPRGLGRRGRVRATGDDGGDRHLCGLGTLGRRWRMGPRS